MNLAISYQNSFQRILLGVGSTALGQVLAAAQAIALVPLFLHAWGREEYGRWLALTAVISYLTLLDLGGQSYIGNLLAIDHAHSDAESFRVRLSEAVSLFTGIACSVFVAVIILLFLFPLLLPFLAGSLSQLPESRMTILFLSGSLLLTIPTGVYVTTYRATGLFVRGALVGTAARALELVSLATLLLISVPPVVYACALMSAAILRSVFILRDIRRNIPLCSGVRLSLPLAWRGRIYLKGALLFWLMSLSVALNQYGVILVLSATVGPVAVAIYATHRTAAGLVGYASSLLQGPLWPELSYLWARNSHTELRQAALLAVRTVAFVSGLTGLILWTILPVIYPIWTRHQFSLEPDLLLLFLSQSVLASIWSTASWSLLAANQHRLPALWSLGNACVTVGLAAILTSHLGVRGAAIATLTGDILCGFLVFPYLTSRFLSVPIREFISIILLIGLSLVPLLASVVYVTWVLPEGWGWLACSGLVAVWVLPGLRIALGQAGLQRLLSVIRLRRVSPGRS